MHGADRISWINNPPMGNLIGGVWEKQITTARGALKVLVKTHVKRLKDGSFHTLLVFIYLPSVTICKSCSFKKEANLNRPNKNIIQIEL